MAAFALAAAAFVGTHFLLSHPLREALVGRLGVQGFRGLYSLVALLTFGVMLWAYMRAGPQSALWDASAPVVLAATLLMWLASVLFAGSFAGNPALPGAKRAPGPRGVLRLTRHPMMWSFAIWALVHAALIATPKALVLDAAIAVLALGGAAAQDRRKLRELGGWRDWQNQTGFWLFSRGIAWPGFAPLLIGTLLWLAASWLHPYPVGPWMLLG